MAQRGGEDIHDIPHKYSQYSVSATMFLTSKRPQIRAEAVRQKRRHMKTSHADISQTTGNQRFNFNDDYSGISKTR